LRQQIYEECVSKGQGGEIGLLIMTGRTSIPV